MSTLQLNLRGEYFDAIKAGDKREEYRLATPYWARRLHRKDFETITLLRGYPPRGDTQRTLVLPWRGYRLRTIRHPYFGPDPVRVFAIRLETPQ